MAVKQEKYPYRKNTHSMKDLLRSSENYFSGGKNPYLQVANEFKSKDTVRGLSSMFTLDIDEDDEI